MHSQTENYKGTFKKSQWMTKLNDRESDAHLTNLAYLQFVIWTNRSNPSPIINHVFELTSWVISNSLIGTARFFLMLSATWLRLAGAAQPVMARFICKHNVMIFGYTCKHQIIFPPLKIKRSHLHFFYLFFVIDIKLVCLYILILYKNNTTIHSKQQIQQGNWHIMECNTFKQFKGLILSSTLK